MNAMFKHAHVGVHHHEHHYISHMIHNEHFWAGIGITLLVGVIVALAIYAGRMEVLPPISFPAYGYGY